MCRQINEDLQKLLQYCQGNKLKVHLEKFQCMLITTSKRRQQQLLTSHPNSVITVNGTPLQYQETMKYLGVKIDNILKFDSHIEYIKNKVAKKVGFLQRIGDSLSPWTRHVVYNTTKAPHFNTDLVCLFLSVLFHSTDRNKQSRSLNPAKAPKQRYASHSPMPLSYTQGGYVKRA
jgi:hypothetical protein